MLKHPKYLNLMLTFGISYIIITASFLINTLNKMLKGFGDNLTNTNLIIEIILLTLVWTSILSIPMASYFACTKTYSKFLKKHIKGKRISFQDYLNLHIPAVTLGGISLLICLVLSLFIVHNTNHRMAQILFELKTGSRPTHPNLRSDREMSLLLLLKDASEFKEKAENTDVERRKRMYMRMNYKYRVEVFKKISIPLSSFLLPILGSLLSLLLLKLKRFRKVVLIICFFTIFILQWSALITGENLGDRMILNPEIGIFISPIFLSVLIVGFFFWNKYLYVNK